MHLRNVVNYKRELALLTPAAPNMAIFYHIAIAYMMMLIGLP